MTYLGLTYNIRQQKEGYSNWNNLLKIFDFNNASEQRNAIITHNCQMLHNSQSHTNRHVITVQGIICLLWQDKESI